MTKKETATILKIKRIETKNKYVVILDKKLSITTFSNKIKFKFKPDDNYKVMFANLANLFRLSNPKYRKNIKVTLASVFKHYGLLKNGKFDFENLVGKQVYVAKKGIGLKYNKADGVFIKGLDKNFLAILVADKDRNSIDRLIEKLSKNKEEVTKIFETIRNRDSEGKTALSKIIDRELEKSKSKLEKEVKDYIFDDNSNHKLPDTKKHSKTCSVKTILDIAVSVRKEYLALINKSDKKIDTLEEKTDCLKKENKQLEENVDSLRKKVRKLTAKCAKWDRDYDELKGYYLEAISRK